ncbi:hypothetical protein PFDG_05283 [Plasmodium falciparum Dd2]|uniref:Uncharacterized protein n=1 Tax=Plasmodium falciparum (isolate Dd2) TaxID=57267 RepID=A0A0L7MA44_PLAF4|nr:hypothetical protein PFDG_05283 [Plasmodium falciparum Dd2]
MISYNSEIKSNKENNSLEMNAKYLNVQYVHIPTSYKDTLNLFCTIILKEEPSNLIATSYLGYVSFIDEFNFSLFNFYESFVPGEKTLQ